MTPRRPFPHSQSAHEVMQRMELQRQQEKKRALRGLDIASVVVFGGAVAVTCVPPFRLLPAIIILPAMGILLLLSIIMLVKGGILSGLSGLFFSLVVLPLWMVLGPSMIEGVQKAGSLEAYRAAIEEEQQEIQERIQRRAAERRQSF